MTETLLILLPLMLAHLAAAISPGPSFVLIVRTAAARSRMSASLMAVGLGLGAAIWAAAALFGLSLVFEIWPWSLTVLRVLGGAFLIWLAWQLVRHAEKPLAEAMADTAPRSALGDIRHGLLVQIANPKVSVFFGSVFVTLLPPDPSLGLLTSLLALIFLVETGWYLIVAAAFATSHLRRRYIGAKAWVDRACGGALGVMGLRIAIG